MNFDPVIIAFDTSAAHCAACVLVGDRIGANIVKPMARGQAETIPSLLDDVLKQSGQSWDTVTAIAVGTGPGNFTGIRISVSLARGLSLARNIPAIGVTQFDATWLNERQNAVATVPAPRDQIYYAMRNSGIASATLGTQSDADALGLPVLPQLDTTTLVERIALVAHQRLAQTDRHDKPIPFYIKPADAAPSKDTAPQRLT